MTRRRHPPTPAKIRRELRTAGDLAPPETAVLNPEQLAAWFQVSGRQVERIPNLPYVIIGGPTSRSKRYLVRTVLAHLEAEARKSKKGDTA